MENENQHYTLDDLRADTEAVERELAAVHAKNQAVLDQVSTLVPPEAFQQITEYLSDSGWTFDYQLVGEPVGAAQDEGFLLGEIYVNQTMNGGYSGDDYAGTVCMPISAGRYFQFAYSC